MYLVTFETWPDPQHQQAYLEHAQAMRAEVEKIQGFIGVERFQSLYEDGKLLSMSLWQSQEAIAQWRAQAEHRIAQAMGRNNYFKAYRIRVAKVEREYAHPA